MLDAVIEVNEEIQPEGMKALRWRPIADDFYLGDAFARGIREHAKNIPVMIGCTYAEMPALRIRNKHDLSEDEQIGILRECFPGQDIDPVIREFKKAWPGKCLTDIIETESFLGRTGVIDYADLRFDSDAADTFVYLFAHEFPQDGGRNAWHCADIPVVYRNSKYYPENFHSGLENGLEDWFSSAFVRFAKTGNPNPGALDMVWPAYRKECCATMIFDDVPRVDIDFDREYTKLRHSLRLEMIEKHRNTVSIN